MTRVDSRLSFDLNRALPVPGLSSEQYSVRWTGVLLPPAAGTYKLQVRLTGCESCGDRDSYRLYVGNELVLRNEDSDKLKKNIATLAFADTRPRPLRLELRHRGGDGISLEWEAPASALLDQAMAAAAEADILVAVVGLSPNLEGEALDVKLPGFAGGDRTSLALPDAQRALLERLQATGKPLVVVLSSGSAVAFDPALLAGPHRAAAILASWYSGEAGGTALAEILSGRVNPSGRLPVTFYRSTNDLPAFEDYSMEHRTYRYYDGPVEFGFGFGLSYAQFTYSDLVLERQVIAAGDKQIARVTIRNTSHVDGTEAAELYLAPPLAPGSPRLALAGIKRVSLRAGESREVVFTLEPRQLSFVDAAGRRSVQPGVYRIFAGSTQPAPGALEPRGAKGSSSFTIVGEQPMAE